jgi:Holliday junction resolvase RusA-like endonuclease
MKAWQNEVGWQAKQIGVDAITGNVSVKMYFFISDERKKDLDNLSKSCLDGMKDILFGDDSEVIRLLLTKEVCKTNPGVMIEIESVD